jgi:hypothetical protein
MVDRRLRPSKKPQDTSDARLIIMDGHGSHVTDGWMSFCFLNNIYCCCFPAHCSHRVQPLDNGPFNSLKAVYRKGLKTLNSLNDACPIDKINFIRAYSKARSQDLTEQNIKSAFRTTENWPISRRKALSHPEIQQIQEPSTPDRKLAPETCYNSEVTLKTSRNVRDMGINKSPTIRRRYGVIAKGFAQLEFQLSTKNANIAASEAEVARLTKTRKRKSIPNPNKRFMLLGDVLANGESVVENEDAIAPLAVEEPVEEVEDDDENDDDADDEEIPLMHYSRLRRAVKRPCRYV